MVGKPTRQKEELLVKISFYFLCSILSVVLVSVVLSLLLFCSSATVKQLRRNLIEDGAISSFSGQKSVPE